MDTTEETRDVSETPEITADTAAALGAVARVRARLAELAAAEPRPDDPRWRPLWGGNFTPPDGPEENR